MRHLQVTCIVLILLSFASCWAIKREDVPDNGKFSIGRETITSFGYASFSGGVPCFVGNDYSTIFAFNSISYGITPHIGCTFTVPFIAHARDNDKVAAGLWDIRCNMQWHLYRSEEHILVLKTGMWFPTGDIKAQVPLGTGSFNPTVYIMGLHSSDRLFANFVFGAIITTPRKHRKIGSLLDYQLSIGPKFQLHTPGNGKLYTFVELQGFHNFLSTYKDALIPNTGWHLLLVGPTLSYDTDFYQITGNILLPIVDRRNGIQPSTDFYASLWYGVRF